MEVLIRVEVSTDTADPKITTGGGEGAQRKEATKTQRKPESIYDWC